MNKTEAMRIPVDFAHLEEIRRLGCVTEVETEPRIAVKVRSELTPDFDTIARLGDTIEVETRRRCPWVHPELGVQEFGRAFAGWRLPPEEGGGL